MFLAEYEDKVDPDTILLPGASAPNLNTLEQFELDYSQVDRRRGRRLYKRYNLVLCPYQALSLQPQKESSSESIVECGVSLLNSLNIHTNPRQHSKLALVAKTLGIISNMILLFLSKAWPKTRLGYFRYQQYHYERIHLATTYSITKKMGSLALQENISKNEEYFDQLTGVVSPPSSAHK